MPELNNPREDRVHDCCLFQHPANPAPYPGKWGRCERNSAGHATCHRERVPSLV